MRRRPATLLLALTSLAAACADAQEAPGMDQVGLEMAATGETLRRRADTLAEAAAAATGTAQTLAREAAAQWRAQGDALSTEGARVRRAAEIVGQTTGGGRRPADASRVIIFGIEAEGEALLGTAGRLEEAARSLGRSAAQLRAAGITVPEAPGATSRGSPLDADVKALQVLAGRARRAGQGMVEQARRYRQSLGERVP